MGAAWMLCQWTRQVRRLVPDLHGHQAKSLTLAAISMCLSGRCQSTFMALVAPVDAKPASTRRRIERFLANPRINTPEVAMGMVRALIGDKRGDGRHHRTLRLMIDETPLRNHLRCMKVSVGYHHRALPLAWICYRPDRLPATQPEIVELLLHQVYHCLPPMTSVVLMADRGLSWPSLIDVCNQLKWDYLLRIQGHTVVKLPDGSERCIKQLVPHRGQSWLGSVRVFKQAGWRESNVVAVWEPKQSDPWLLITSLPAQRLRCREYCKRMWQEESFRDEKSHGFGWGCSCVRNPEHADRLLLAMQLATWMTTILGLEIRRQGRCSEVEATSAPSLSLFQIGYRAWRIPGLYQLIRGPTSIRLQLDDEDNIIDERRISVG